MWFDVFNKDNVFEAQDQGSSQSIDFDKVMNTIHSNKKGNSELRLSNKCIVGLFEANLKTEWSKFVIF